MQAKVYKNYTIFDSNAKTTTKKTVRNRKVVLFACDFECIVFLLRK